jgi:hypothetical protein
MTEASPRADRWFFSAMALVIAALVAIGFAPTFYLRASEAAPLTAVVRAHGALGTAWVLSFLAQTWLVAAARVAVHRRLGALGAALAAAFVVTGAFTIAAFERAHGPEPGRFLAPHLFTNVAPLAAFAIFVAAGILERARPDRHKRFMLLAAVVLLPPAIGRLFGVLDLATFNLLAYSALAFANALYDTVMRGRPHAVAFVGASALVAIDVTTTAWLAAVGS